MEIKTKYNIGDEVWYLSPDYYKIRKSVIMEIRICNDESVLYILQSQSSYFHSETEIFPTEQELIEYLRRENDD
jgi:hypothetical protein